jgi:hypothetical protein
VLAASRSPYTAKGRLIDSLLFGENRVDDLPSSSIVPVADAAGIRKATHVVAGVTQASTQRVGLKSRVIARPQIAVHRERTGQS